MDYIEEIFYIIDIVDNSDEYEIFSFLIKNIIHNVVEFQFIKVVLENDFNLYIHKTEPTTDFIASIKFQYFPDFADYYYLYIEESQDLNFMIQPLDLSNGSSY